MSPQKIAFIVGAILVVVSTVWYTNQKIAQQKTTVSGTAPASTTNDTDPTKSAANISNEEKKMSYDMTVQSDGLSKATATMTLEKGGVIKWRFFANEAPNTAKRIAQLISEGFYNGIVFHRVVPGFVVQGGDPTGTGMSGSGTKLKAEFNSIKHEPGIVSMARTQDPDSADSQFFMMLGRTPHLDNQYTVFAKIVEGGDLVPSIKQGDKIKTFTIE